MHPQSGRVFWLVLPYLNARLMQRFLDEFARTHATPGKRIVMVTDAAAAHRATTLRVPERITLVRLPPSTPELNPTERLWTMVREGVANRDFSTLDGLEQSVCTRCQKISAVPEQVTALTNYHWLPTTGSHFVMQVDIIMNKRQVHLSRSIWSAEYVITQPNSEMPAQEP